MLSVYSSDREYRKRFFFYKQRQTIARWMGAVKGNKNTMARD